MRLKLGKYMLNLNDVRNEVIEKSPITNKELHVFEHLISVRAEEFDSFNNHLDEFENGGVYSVDSDENNIKEYEVLSKGYSYVNNGRENEIIYNFNLQFKERDNQSLEALIISGLYTVPYMIEQRYDNAIIINARIKLSNDEMDRFIVIRDGEEYFEVIRKGIDDNPLKMRFGKIIWSEHENFFKVEVTLVEESYDREENSNSEPFLRDLFQPEMNNIIKMLAYQQSFNKYLVELLQIKGLLIEEEISRIKDKSEQEVNRTLAMLYKINDIDIY